MNLILTIDNNNGLAFNRRRQSRDAALISDVLDLVDGKLMVAPYSQMLFGDDAITEEDPLTAAGKNDWCFLEKTDPADYEGEIGKLVLYKWNRDYPADTYLTIDVNDGSWELLEAKDFEGNSHDEITREIYKKVE